MKASRSIVSKVRSAGFTLVEFMVTLVIVAILLAVGVPSFNSLIQSQQLTTTVNEFFAAINLTRAEAIKRNGRVDLAPLDGVNWSNGWVVSAGGATIFQSNAMPHGISVASSLTSDAIEPGQPYIAYTATGRTRTNASLQLPQAGTISFTQGAEVRRIKINFLGRARVCNPAIDKATCGEAGSD